MSSLFEQASLIVTPNATKAGKLYSIKPTDGSGDLDVVRATTATRVNSAGLIESVANNVPRLDYTNGSCPSILVEPQRTNLVTFSENTSAWIAFGSAYTQNTAVSPEGYMNADTFAGNGTQIQIFGNAIDFSFPSAGAATISIFAKAGAANFFEIFFNAFAGATNTEGVFNLTNGTTTTAGSKIENYGNGWYRCSQTANIDAGDLTGQLAIRIRPSASDIFWPSAAATIGQNVILWGAQAEAGSYVSSYIPTVATAVTRNADVISKTGISDLIGQSEGTVFVELDIKNTEINRVAIIISSANPSTSESVGYIYINSINHLVFEFFTEGAPQAVISAGAVQFGVQKLAFVYKNNDFAFYRNGTLVGTDTGGTVLSGFDRLFLGCFTNEQLNFNDRINLAVIFKERLTNEQLAQLTTI
jgi:hypothetical protein